MIRPFLRELPKLAPLLLGAMFVLVAGECEDDVTDPEPGMGTLRIVLDHTVGGEALVQNGTEFYTTAEGNDFNVSKLRYVVSRVEVESDDVHGRRRHVEGAIAHLRDAFDDGSRVIEIAGAPAGEYTALSFIFGMDEEMNTPEADYSQTQGEEFADAWIDMNWLPQWGDGYHYMKLEGQMVPSAGRGGNLPLLTHLGRRFAQEDAGTIPPPAPPDAVATPHFFPVTLEFPTAIDLADGETVEIQVVMDILNWYTGPNDVDLDVAEQARAIMMNIPVQTMYEENGRDATLPVFSLGTITEVD